MQHLPEAVQHSLEDPESAYSFGYSCGKEALEDGRPDSNKVSYYANPQHNTITQDADLRQRYSGYCRRDHVEDMFFQRSLKALPCWLVRQKLGWMKLSA